MTVDSLEIVVESKLADVNRGFEGLIGNLNTVIEKISTIQNSANFKQISNSAKNVSQSMKKVGEDMAQAMKPMQEQTKQAQKEVSEVLKNFQEKFKNIPVKVDFSKPESELKRFENQAKNAENALTRIMASSNADKQIKSIEKLSIVLAQANNAIEQIQDNLSKTATLDIATPKIDSSDYKPGYIEHLENIGAYRLAQEYLEDIQNSAQQATESIREFNSAFDSSAMSDVFGEAARGVENWSQVIEQLGDNAVISLHELSQPFEVQINGVEEAEQQIRSLSEPIQNMKNLFIQTFADLKNGEIFRYLSESVRNFAKNVRVTAVNAISDFASSLKNLIPKIKNAISRFSSLAKSILGVNRVSKGMNTSFLGGFMTVLKYSFGIRSLYVLFNKLRSAVKEGMGNLIQYSDRTNQSVSMLKSSLNQLKNSAAAALAPILNAIAPALNTLIQLFIQAANAVNQFFAALTGQSTWIKAKYVYDDVAESISGAAKAAKGALQPFDKLNNLTSQTGAGGGGALPEDMFETKPIEDKFKNFLDWLKSMWDKADFTDLGSLLGQKLKDALDNIPWTEIKEKARKLAKSLATLINGFIETEGLGYSIGRTLAEALNTGFAFLNEFVHEIHADSIGKFLAEIINGITQSIEWDVIYDTFTTAAHKIAEFVNNLFSPENLDYESISSTMSNFVNTIVDSIYILITETEWAEIGESFGKAISDTFVGIDWGKAGQTVGEAFKAFFNFIATTIENIDWWAVGESVKNFLIGIDWNGVADAFFEAVGAAFGGFAAFLGGLIAESVVSAGEYFQDKIEEAGGNIVDGILLGVRDGLANIAEWLLKHVYEPFMEGFCNAFGIHSPSTVMAEMGKYIIQGLLNGLKETWGNVTSWLQEKLQWLKDKIKAISSAFSGISGKAKSVLGNSAVGGGISGALGGILGAKQTSNYNINSTFENYSTAYPTFESYSINPALTNPSEYVFPAYANGQVITPSMGEHLAWLGDNKSETEVVSPLSTIEKALENVINRFDKAQSSNGGYSGDSGDIVINIDGEEVFRVTRQKAQEYRRRTGKMAFT